MLKVWPLALLLGALLAGGAARPVRAHDTNAWLISSGGTKGWKKINDSIVPLSSLRFGDFNGDGKADIFRLVPEMHAGLSVRRHSSTTLTNAAADAILASATTTLQTADGGDDVPCMAHLSRVGAVTAFTAGDGNINSEDDADEVFDLPGFVKLVNMINVCGDKVDTFAGCAPTPGDTQMVVRRATTLREGILWLHEYGHTRGLEHSGDDDAVMFKSLADKRLRVTASECESYRD